MKIGDNVYYTESALIRGIIMLKVTDIYEDKPDAVYVGGCHRTFTMGRDCYATLDEAKARVAELRIGDVAFHLERIKQHQDQIAAINSPEYIENTIKVTDET